MNEEEDFTVMVPLSFTDAIKVADFLDAYGNEEDANIAANIRYVAEQAKRTAAATGGW